MGRPSSIFLLFFLSATPSFALVSPGATWKARPKPAPPAAPRPANQVAGVVEHLGAVRNKVLDAEKGVIESLRREDQARARALRLKALLALRTQERSAHALLKQVGRYAQLDTGPALRPEREKTEGPRRRVTVALIARGTRQIEALRGDLMDAEVLAEKIRSEKESLSSLFAEIEGNESAIRFQAALESDVLKKRHAERLGQLERYHELKRSQAALEGLLKQFNARIELERLNERSARAGAFTARKGSLPLPLLGEIVSTFGKSRDPESNLVVLRKGLEIRAPQATPVRAVFPGRVAYSGTLPGYGLLAIVDHGSNYYTLMARVASLSVREGDLVKEGDVIGMTGAASSPLYFEVRDRNVAVDPLRWVARSNTL